MKLPYTQFVRHFSLSTCLLRRPNIQRPLVPGMERRILDAITVPIFPPDHRPLPIKCYEEEKLQIESRKSELSEAYKLFRLKQAIKIFNEQKMIAVCHALPMNSRDFLGVRTKITLARMKLVFMRNDIAIQATQDTRLQNLIPFFKSDNAYIVCDEVKLAELIKLLRKVSELQLLGGLVEDRIMSRQDMMNAAKLPPLDTLRGELLTILKASASKTNHLLGQHQKDLSWNLDQLVRQETENEGEGGK